jgi:hypothetical protein
MSDDTPTQRYPEGFPPPGGQGGGAGDGTTPATTPPATPPTPPTAPTTPHDPYAVADDLPTERFSAAGTQPPAGTAQPYATAPQYAATPRTTVPPQTTPPPPQKSQKGLIITLAVIGGVLLLALIGVLIWVGISSGSPDPQPTETETPSSTPTQSDTPSPSPSPSETTPPPPPANVIASFTASTETADCTNAVGGSVPVTFSWATTGVTMWFGVGTDDAKAEPFGEFPLNHTIDFDYQCGQPDLQQRYTITVERTDGSTQSQTILIREV